MEISLSLFVFIMGFFAFVFIIGILGILFARLLLKLNGTASD